jgi:Bacterial regulatory proteins, gntR family
VRATGASQGAGYNAPVRASRQLIVRELQRRIRERIYLPGSRLPSRRTLQRELGGSPLTLQAAFDQLAQQGYAVPRGTRGTFVAERLPGESVIALVFHDGFEQGSWNRFWSALHHVAHAALPVTGAPGRVGQFRSYCLPGGRAEGAVHRQLCADLADGALQGVLFTSPPPAVDCSALFTAAVPRVCIDTAALGTYAFATSHLHTTDAPVLEGMLRHFRAAGRTRIAGLAGNPHHLERIRTLAAGHGLEARAEWWHGMPTDPAGALSCRRLVQLLGTLAPRRRPDCLIIADDNLVTPATLGCLDASWRVGSEIEIAAHANFPLATHAAVPCRRYGLDARAVLRAAAAEIGRLAAGAAPRVIEVPFACPGDGP